MRRFFSTSRAALRIPPGAPSRVKEIPVPRTARTTSEINKYVDVTPRETPETPITSEYVKTMFPDISSEPSLKNSTESADGVWYHIARSRAGNLPVYTDYNNAGGVWTEVRKVTGNAGALRNDLKKLLGLQNNEIWVKNAANVVVIKGNKLKEIKRILHTI